MRLFIWRIPARLHCGSLQPNAQPRLNLPVQMGELPTFSDILTEPTTRYAASRVGYTEQSNDRWAS
jgi:hypothetical protein